MKYSKTLIKLGFSDLEFRRLLTRWQCLESLEYSCQNATAVVGKVQRGIPEVPRIEIEPRRLEMFRAVLIIVILIVPTVGYTQQTIREVVDAVLPAVVVIKTPDGIGSGVLLDSSGVIVTNLHVIEGAKEATIELQNGDSYNNISVIDVDTTKDIALLKIPAFDLPVVTMGNSNEISVGDDVVVMGAPSGLEQTVTRGIVSAIRDTGEGYRLFQTDAAISPGSSGGGMFDMNGNLVGVTVSYLEGSQNINFVIPINYVRGLYSTTAKYSLEELASVTNSNTSNSSNAADSSSSSLDEFILSLNASLDEKFEKDEENGSWYIFFEDAVLTVSEAGGIVMTQLFNGSAQNLSQDQMKKLLEESYMSNYGKIGLSDNATITAMNETPLSQLTVDYFANVLEAVFDLEEAINQITNSNASENTSPPSILLNIEKTALTRSTRERDVSRDFQNGAFTVSFDPSSWEELPLDDNVSDADLYLSNGDSFIQIISESSEFSYEVMSNVIVTNAQSIDPNAALVNSGFREVNGRPIYWAHINAEFEGIRFRYYYHIYTGAEGTIQLVSWSTLNISDSVEASVDEFVSSLTIN